MMAIKPKYKIEMIASFKSIISKAQKIANKSESSAITITPAPIEKSNTAVKPWFMAYKIFCEFCDENQIQSVDRVFRIIKFDFVEATSAKYLKVLLKTKVAKKVLIKKRKKEIEIRTSNLSFLSKSSSPKFAKKSET